MTTNDFNEQERLNAKEQEINDKLNSVAQDLCYFKFGTVAIQICFLIEVINIIKLGKPLTSDCFAFVFNSVLLLASFFAWKVSLNCESSLLFRLTNSLDTMKGAIYFLDIFIWYYSFCLAYVLYYYLPDNLSNYKIWICFGLGLVCIKIFAIISGLNKLKRLIKDPHIALGFKYGLDTNVTSTSKKYIAITGLLNIALLVILLIWALKGMPHLFIFK